MGEPDPREEPGRVDELLRPFLTDSMLWPVAIVLVLSVSSFFAQVIVRAFEKNLFAVAALLVLSWMSYGAVRGSIRGGRPGPLALLVFALWVVSAAGAVAGARLGLL